MQGFRQSGGEAFWRWSEVPDTAAPAFSLCPLLLYIALAEKMASGARKSALCSGSEVEEGGGERESLEVPHFTHRTFHKTFFGQ